MKIIESYGPHSALFIVLKPFSARPLGEPKTRILIAGEQVRFDEKTHASEIIGWCRFKRIALADLPDIGRYRVQRQFTHRIGEGKTVTVSKHDVCEIRAEDAWEMLLSGIIVPLDGDAWSPAKLRKDLK